MKCVRKFPRGESALGLRQFAGENEKLSAFNENRRQKANNNKIKFKKGS